MGNPIPGLINPLQSTDKVSFPAPKWSFGTLKTTDSESLSLNRSRVVLNLVVYRDLRNVSINYFTPRPPQFPDGCFPIVGAL